MPGLRRVALIAVPVLLVLGGVALGTRRVVAGDYQPLVAGGYRPPAGWIEEEQPVPADLTRYRGLAEYGDTVTFDVDVRNEGRWPVTILGLVPQPAAQYLLLRLESMSWELSASPPRTGSAPVEVLPGQHIRLLFRGRFGNCQFYVAGGGQSFSAVGIRTRALGLTRDIELPMGMELFSESPPKERCPSPEDLGAQRFYEPVEGALVRRTHLMICLSDAGREQCYALPVDSQWSYDSEAMPGSMVRLSPSEAGTVWNMDVVEASR